MQEDVSVVGQPKQLSQTELDMQACAQRADFLNLQLRDSEKAHKSDVQALLGIIGDYRRLCEYARNNTDGELSAAIERQLQYLDKKHTGLP